VHKTLLQEWAESPPDVSYRFVVSPGTLRAAEAVASAILMKRRSRWHRALAFLMSLAGYYLEWTLYIVLVSWLSGGVRNVVGIESGVVSGVFNLESSGVGASDRRPRHDKSYHKARFLTATK
jgi:hypothetical protein